MRLEEEELLLRIEDVGVSLMRAAHSYDTHDSLALVSGSWLVN